MHIQHLKMRAVYNPVLESICVLNILVSQATHFLPIYYILK